MTDRRYQNDNQPSLSSLQQIETLHVQGTGEWNEDAILVADNVFGVFDGATSLTGARYQGETGGSIAARLAVEVFGQNDEPLERLAAKANAAIAREMRNRGVNLGCKEELWSTSAAVVKVQGNRLEWCQTGDCRIQIVFHDGSTSQLVDPPAQDAETFARWKVHGPVSREPIQVALADQILAVRRRMNIDYGVLNGEPEALEFIKSGTIDLHEIKAVLLFTDGLVVPDPLTGSNHDSDLLVNLFSSGGLECIHRHVSSLQKSDPDCLLYPRFKQHDDIGAIALYH